MVDAFSYQWSDAWLLLSIIYSSRDHPASLGEVLMAGDYINHTGFTQEEMDGGLSRLKAGGWIGRSTERLSVNPKALDAYKAIAAMGLSASGELKQLEHVLGIKDAP